MRGVPTHAIDEEVKRLRRLCPAEDPATQPPQPPQPPEGRRRGGRGRISVLCRFRPSPGEEPAWSVTEHTVTEKGGLSGSQSFGFDKVFGPEATQASVYEDVEHIVQGVLSGVNGSILCYGQTSAGKTFTMEGPPDCHDDELRGIIPRALATLFEQAAELSRGDSGDAVCINVSMLELYLERLRDLLDERVTRPAQRDASMSANDLQIITHRSGFVRVQGLSSVSVRSLEDALAIFKCGQGRRMVGATNMNAGSSRSHSIVMLQVVRTRGGRTTTAKLCLADLAGSENLKKSRFRGDLAANASITEEAKVINKSLSTLGCVIQRLSRGGDAHVPFRDSKLTRVLQDAISGISNSALIINCASSKRHAAETLSTLRFGACAKRIVSLPTSAQESRVQLLLHTLRMAVGELERLKLAENLQRLSDLEASAERPQQGTPPRRRQSGLDNLSPVLEAPQRPALETPPRPSLPGKRWAVGRSSSPLSGISASSSRSQSLDSARRWAALQRKAGLSLPAVPPLPHGLCLGSARRHAGLSPLSLSPGPSTAAWATPRRARGLSPATPLSPKASDFACSIIEMPPLQHCGIGGLSWEWPMTQRQVLERDLAATRLKVGQLTQAHEAEEEWLAWLREPLLGCQWQEDAESAPVPIPHLEEPTEACSASDFPAETALAASPERVSEERGLEMTRSKTLSLCRAFVAWTQACSAPDFLAESAAAGSPERVSEERGSETTRRKTLSLCRAFVAWTQACSVPDFLPESAAAGSSERVSEERGSEMTRRKTLSLCRAFVAWTQACQRPVDLAANCSAAGRPEPAFGERCGDQTRVVESVLVCFAFMVWAQSAALAENKAHAHSVSDEVGRRRARLQDLFLCRDVFALWAQALAERTAHAHSVSSEFGRRRARLQALFLRSDVFAPGGSETESSESAVEDAGQTSREDAGGEVRGEAGREGIEREAVVDTSGKSDNAEDVSVGDAGSEGSTREPVRRGAPTPSQAGAAEGGSSDPEGLVPPQPTPATSEPEQNVEEAEGAPGQAGAAEGGGGSDPQHDERAAAREDEATPAMEQAPEEPEQRLAEAEGAPRQAGATQGSGSGPEREESVAPEQAEPTPTTGRAAEGQQGRAGVEGAPSRPGSTDDGCSDAKREQHSTAREESVAPEKAEPTLALERAPPVPQQGHAETEEAPSQAGGATQGGSSDSHREQRSSAREAPVTPEQAEPTPTSERAPPVPQQSPAGAQGAPSRPGGATQGAGGSDSHREQRPTAGEAPVAPEQAEPTPTSERASEEPQQSPAGAQGAPSQAGGATQGAGPDPEREQRPTAGEEPVAPAQAEPTLASEQAAEAHEHSPAETEGVASQAGATQGSGSGPERERPRAAGGFDAGRERQSTTREASVVLEQAGRTLASEQKAEESAQRPAATEEVPSQAGATEGGCSDPEREGQAVAREESVAPELAEPALASQQAAEEPEPSPAEMEGAPSPAGATEGGRSDPERERQSAAREGSEAHEQDEPTLASERAPQQPKQRPAEAGEAASKVGAAEGGSSDPEPERQSAAREEPVAPGRAELALASEQAAEEPQQRLAETEGAPSQACRTEGGGSDPERGQPRAAPEESVALGQADSTVASERAPEEPQQSPAEAEGAAPGQAGATEGGGPDTEIGQPWAAPEESVAPGQADLTLASERAPEEPQQRLAEAEGAPSRAGASEGGSSDSEHEKPRAAREEAVAPEQAVEEPEQGLAETEGAPSQAGATEGGGSDPEREQSSAACGETSASEEDESETAPEEPEQSLAGTEGVPSQAGATESGSSGPEREEQSEQAAEEPEQSPSETEGALSQAGATEGGSSDPEKEPQPPAPEESAASERDESERAAEEPEQSPSETEGALSQASATEGSSSDPEPQSPAPEESAASERDESQDSATEILARVERDAPSLPDEVPPRERQDEEHGREEMGSGKPRAAVGRPMLKWGRRLLAGTGIVTLTPLVLAEAAWRLGPEVEPFM